MTEIEIPIMNYKTWWKPSSESPVNMIRVCEPNDKDVVHIAGYGGYAEWLLAEGAKSVTSIDISQDAINANLIQHALLSDFTFDEVNCLMLFGDWLTDYKGWIDSLSEKTKLPEEYLRDYFGKMNLEAYLDVYPDENQDEFISFQNISFREHWPYIDYPEIDARGLFSRLQEAVKDNRWQIRHQELLSYLSECAESSADIIYISTVRNWILASYMAMSESPGVLARPVSRSEISLFENEFDKPLAAATYRCLRNGGRMIEASPNIQKVGFPDYPPQYQTCWKDFIAIENNSSLHRISEVKKYQSS